MLIHVHPLFQKCADRLSAVLRSLIKQWLWYSLAIEPQQTSPRFRETTSWTFPHRQIAWIYFSGCTHYTFDQQADIAPESDAKLYGILPGHGSSLEAFNSHQKHASDTAISSRRTVTTNDVNQEFLSYYLGLPLKLPFDKRVKLTCLMTV